MEVCRGRDGRGVDRQWKFIGEGRGQIDNHLRGDQHCLPYQRGSSVDPGGRLTIVSQVINTVCHVRGNQHCWSWGRLMIISEEINTSPFQRDQHLILGELMIISEGIKTVHHLRGISTVDPGEGDWQLFQRGSTLLIINCWSWGQMIVSQGINTSPSQRGPTLLILRADQQSCQRGSTLLTMSDGINSVDCGGG